MYLEKGMDTLLAGSGVMPYEPSENTVESMIQWGMYFLLRILRNIKTLAKKIRKKLNSTSLMELSKFIEMAKIGNIEFTIGSKYPKSYPLYYTQKYKFEIRGVDEEFFHLTKTSNMGYSTEQDLKLAMYEAIPIYHKLKEEQRLVILYRCSASTALRMNKTGRGSYTGLLPEVSRKITSINGAPYCTVGIDYEVYMEIFNGKDFEYYEVGEDMEVVSSHKETWNRVSGFSIMEYTPENLEFFNNIKSSMQEMVRKLSTFFGLDAEQAQLMIQDNLKILEQSNSKKPNQ